MWSDRRAHRFGLEIRLTQSKNGELTAYCNKNAAAYQSPLDDLEEQRICEKAQQSQKSVIQRLSLLLVGVGHGRKGGGTARAVGPAPAFTAQAARRRVLPTRPGDTARHHRRHKPR